ncbi:hypothetical protein CPB83DRAFT_152007 [Crepidotus variabilis]|uniref:CXC domain-containing protein n=1 Tax=Crepidotus variabilis TaxID=179855 RepID=A0A9P6E3R7_9AGAR|nr:hypothetical protein CPB83DRAFT_152007 [Crepidotus variabilis]
MTLTIFRFFHSRTIQDIPLTQTLRNTPTCVVEVVAFATVRKLIANNGVTFEDIDATKAFLSPSRRLVDLHKKSDLPQWPALKEALSIQIPRQEFTPKALHADFLELFCNNRNCVISFCSTHEHTSSPRPRAPKIPYSKLGDTTSRPCGNRCFLEPSSSVDLLVHGTAWDSNDIELLHCILKFSPDILPCDLAMICRKPCREVHRQRAELRSSVADLPVDKHRNRSNNLPRDFEEDSTVFTPPLPCQHQGPCNNRTACACYKNKARCHTRCGCTKTCPRRWKGCSCAKRRAGATVGVCRTNHCSCFREKLQV